MSFWADDWWTRCLDLDGQLEQLASDVSHAAGPDLERIEAWSIATRLRRGVVRARETKTAGASDGRSVAASSARGEVYELNTSKVIEDDQGVRLESGFGLGSA